MKIYRYVHHFLLQVYNIRQYFPEHASVIIFLPNVKNRRIKKKLHNCPVIYALSLQSYFYGWKIHSLKLILIWVTAILGIMSAYRKHTLKIRVFSLHLYSFMFVFFQCHCGFVSCHRYLYFDGHFIFCI